VDTTLAERPRESLAGLALLALGLPVYWYAARRRRRTAPRADPRTG
jgi:hypothetical protein